MSEMVQDMTNIAITNSNPKSGGPDSRLPKITPTKKLQFTTQVNEAT